MAPSLFESTDLGVSPLLSRSVLAVSILSHLDHVEVLILVLINFKEDFKSFSIITTSKSGAYAQTFTKSLNGTIWNELYKTHITNQSFLSSRKGVEKLLNSNDQVTLFSAIESIAYFNSKPCAIKILWKSPERYYESYGFPKNSPILPFFNKAYEKIRESGAWIRIQRKWSKSDGNCLKNDNYKPISIKKAITLLICLATGIAISMIIFFFEILAKLVCYRGELKPY